MNDLITLDSEMKKEIWKQLALVDHHNIRRLDLPGENDLEIANEEISIMMRISMIEDAAEQAEVLLGAYPRAKIDEPAIYSRAIISMLMKYPVVVGAWAVDNLTSTKRFPPSRADVKEACDTGNAKLYRMQNRIKLIRQERIRRAEEVDHLAEVKKSKLAFRLKHGDKSPLEVLREKGIFKGFDDDKDNIK